MLHTGMFDAILAERTFIPMVLVETLHWHHWWLVTNILLRCVACYTQFIPSPSLFVFRYRLLPWNTALHCDFDRWIAIIWLVDSPFSVLPKLPMMKCCQHEWLNHAAFIVKHVNVLPGSKSTCMGPSVLFIFCSNTGICTNQFTLQCASHLRAVHSRAVTHSTTKWHT